MYWAAAPASTTTRNSAECTTFWERTTPIAATAIPTARIQNATFCATALPSVITSSLEVNYLVAQFYGGTGLLIVVSVALDLVQKINSHLVMRNYPGLTDS